MHAGCESATWKSLEQKVLKTAALRHGIFERTEPSSAVGHPFGSGLLCIVRSCKEHTGCRKGRQVLTGGAIPGAMGAGRKTSTHDIDTSAAGTIMSFSQAQRNLGEDGR